MIYDKNAMLVYMCLLLVNYTYDLIDYSLDTNLSQSIVDEWDNNFFHGLNKH